MLQETWRDQYERMQRSFELLKQVGEPTPLPQDVIPARDVLYHFCCDVFHLRDWIAADLGSDEASIKNIAGQLNNDVIRSSPELSACCDVANGSKHRTLHQRSYVTGTKTGHAEIVSQGVTLGLPPARMAVTPEIFAKLVKQLVRDEEGVESVAGDPVEADEGTSPPAPAPAATDSAGDGGYVQDTFTIDINGQQHDAQDVAAKAVAAWDHWIKGPSPSPLAAQLP